MSQLEFFLSVADTIGAFLCFILTIATSGNEKDNKGLERAFFIVLALLLALNALTNGHIIYGA